MQHPYIQSKKNGKKIDQHRRIMQELVGRPLLRWELVHHINGDKRDNRLENLQIVSPKEHSKIHNQKYPLTKICELCGSEFMPHPTKRKRAKTCSQDCRMLLTSRRLRRPDAPRSIYRASAYPSQAKQRIASRRLLKKSSKPYEPSKNPNPSNQPQ